MGRITVKHYLNKKVTPFKELSDSNVEKLMYSVYVQIIYNKFSTNKRSKTLINATLDGFNKYLKNGRIDKNEFDTTLSGGYTLPDEINDITNSIKIINDRKIDISRKQIIKLIDTFSDNIVSCLTFIARTDFEVKSVVDELHNEDNSKAYNDFILAFDGKSNLLKNIEHIKKYTNVDLLPYVKQEDCNKWLAIEIIKKYFGFDISFSKFIHSNYKTTLRKKMKDVSVGKFDVIMNEIDNMIELFIKYHSNYDKDFDENFLI
ncbi:MAG: hypothetical protein LBH30_03105 [Prevotellaceae bacterium]|jgi:hypothetical protein|nr:hypothetical protein [Prevotellaceae bacterium]